MTEKAKHNVMSTLDFPIGTYSLKTIVRLISSIQVGAIVPPTVNDLEIH